MCAFMCIYIFMHAFFFLRFSFFINPFEHTSEKMGVILSKYKDYRYVNIPAESNILELS